MSKSSVTETPKNTLYSLVTQAQAIEQQIMEAGGELSPEVEQALTQVDLSLAEKIDSYDFVMDRLEGQSDYWKAKAALYTKISKSYDGVRERLRTAIKDAMIALNKTEIAGNDVRFKLQNSAPKLIIDEAKVSDKFKMQITTMVIDKERIKSALKDGIPVEGATLEQGQHIRPYANKKD